MKQWVLRGDALEDVSGELSHLPELVRKILYHRGIRNREDADAFLNPDFEKGIGDPFNILNMEKAADRLIEAIKNNEKVVVFGDYDADGVCSSVIFHDFFKKIGFNNFHVHIPDRYLEGYGLTKFAIDEFSKLKANLIVTLDCGVTNDEEVRMANESGMEVIIIDHHLVPDKVPDAYAIVDNKQKEDSYPFKFLCGAGIAFKTICAVVKKGNFKVTPGWEKWLLDAVAIATVADMVPLIGENRVLVYYGLKVLKKTQRAGLKSFYKKFGVSQENITPDDLGFVIAPKINVAGRMDHATVSFNLLATESPQEARWINDRLETMNNDRKDVVEKIIKDINKSIAGGDIGIIVQGDAGWHPGVLSIAANKIMDKYRVPVFLWGKNGGNFKGSCRSKGSINLVEFMKCLPEGLVKDFGGHAFAGGFTVEESKIEEFKREVLDLHRDFPKIDIKNDNLEIDGEFGLDQVGWGLFEELERLQPFGIDNPKPIFAFNDIEIQAIKKFGNGGIHLQLDFKKSGGETVSAIGFFMLNDGSEFNFRKGQRINLAATLEKNSYRGKNELRLRIVDACPAGGII